jgi:peptidoglycan/xylan/chitin deacetylase (PgdA/CDA1 family)
VGLMQRARNKWRRYAIEHWGRHEFVLDAPHAYVSFTFDDFPRTAHIAGGRILREHGVTGTYFVSSALLGGPSPSGPIATTAEIAQVVDEGHEIGCHTREHLDGTRETPETFERSIQSNHEALATIIPSLELDVFAYPLEGPSLPVKRAVGPHFRASRGGGQTFNAGIIDLNLVKSFFIDWKSRDDVEAIRDVIARSAESRGWLIFSSHDIDPTPSPYGCSPATFEQVVSLACASGARVLPMGRVCAELGIDR